MARILRCPACGALWRVDLEDASAQLRCGECGTVFASAKAETLDVDDEVLDEALARRTASDDAEATPEGDAAADTSPDAAPTEDSGTDDTAPASDAKPRSNPLWGLLGTVAVIGLAFGGVLWSADAIVQSAPALRPAFQTACGTLPCPGFAWMDAKAWTVSGEIVDAAQITATPVPLGDPNAVAGDSQATPLQVRIRFENATTRTLLLPLVEVKLLDAAGTPITERLVEPADLGFATVGGDAPRLAPQGRTEALLTITTPLPVKPTDLALKAWDPQLR